MAVICTAMGQQPGSWDTLHPQTYRPRAVGSGSLLSPVAVSDPLCAAVGLVSPLASQGAEVHVLLLWE